MATLVETIIEQPVQIVLKEFNELLENVNPSNVFIPELTRLSMSLSFLSMVLTIIDKGTDGMSVVTSLMAGDLTAGLLTMLFMYLSGIATICIWAAPGHILDVCARLPKTYKFLQYKLCCPCCGGKSIQEGEVFPFGCVACHKPLLWAVLIICIVFAPFSTPILFILYFWRQVSLYRKCEKMADIKDEETISYRDITEVVSQAMIAECFFESAPQVILQMYILATQFTKIRSSQQELRFAITIAVLVSSMLELGVTVGGRWVDNLVAHPLMELKPNTLKVLLYTEAVSFLLVRSTLICGSILVLRGLLGSGLQAVLIITAFLLAPRIVALIIRIRYRLSTVNPVDGMDDYVGKLLSRVVATILFYPISEFQWVYIYIECETATLGLACIFAYYGEYGIKAKIELFHGVDRSLGHGIIYFLCVLYILSIALRWSRVLYLLRTKSASAETTVFKVFHSCQSITKILDQLESMEEDGIETKKFRLRQLNYQLEILIEYFDQNFPSVSLSSDSGPSPCLCNYAQCLSILLVNEEARRHHTLSKFRPAENLGKFVLGESLLYAQLLNLILLRLHTFGVYPFDADDGDDKVLKWKRDVCKGTKWTKFRLMIFKLLFTWILLHKPRCPQQFLSRSPIFKFSNYNLLLDIDKARRVFGVDAPLILWNEQLGRCGKCKRVQHINLLRPDSNQQNNKNI